MEHNLKPLNDLTIKWLEENDMPDGILPGIYPAMPNSVYHDLPGLSWSKAKHLIYELGGGLEFYYGEFIDPKEKSSKSNMDFGNLAHSIVLPDQGLWEFSIMKQDTWDDLCHDFKKPKSSGAYLKWKASVEDSGLVPVTPDQVDVVNDMVASLKKQRVLINGEPVTLFDLLQAGESEVSYFAEINGVLCKAKPDKRIGDLLIDYKTTATKPHPEQFRNQAFKMGYHGQAAWYPMVVAKADNTFRKDTSDFQFIAQMVSWPHVARLIPLDPNFHEMGVEHCLEAIELYKEGTTEGWWPIRDIVESDLPMFANYLRKDS